MQKTQIQSEMAVANSGHTYAKYTYLPLIQSLGQWRNNALILGTSSVSPPHSVDILIDETFGQEAGYLQPQQEAKFLASQAFDSGKNSIVICFGIFRG